MTAERLMATIASGYSAYDAAYEMLDALIAGDRRELRTLADLMLASGSGYADGVIEDVLCHLPIEDLTELVARVMREHDGVNRFFGPADKVVKAAAFQCPQALTPFLPRLWADRLARHGYAASPWRGADAAELDRLVVAAAEETDQHVRARIAMTLIETGQAAGWRHARELEARLDVLSAAERRDRWETVGVDDTHRPGYRRLHAESSYHIMVSEQALISDLPRWLKRRHPTWKLPASQGTATIGGPSDSRCTTAGHGPMRRLLRLDPVPAGCGVTSRSRLELAYCYQCHDGWEPAFFRHGEDGAPQAIEQATTFPELLAFESDEVRAAVTGVLAPTPVRWQVQEWGGANGRQNLNRIGGRPSWIQGPAFQFCPGCERPMPFLAQFDWQHLTNLEGITYLLWCDRCAISSMVYQCT